MTLLFNYGIIGVEQVCNLHYRQNKSAVQACSYVSSAIIGVFACKT